VKPKYSGQARQELVRIGIGERLIGIFQKYAEKPYEGPQCRNENCTRPADKEGAICSPCWIGEGPNGG